MKTYDPEDVQITIGGVPFTGLATIEYGRSAAPLMRVGPDGEYPRGTRRALAVALRRASPEPILIVIDDAAGDGVVRVSIAPDREGEIDAAAVSALCDEVRDEVPLGVDLRVAARSRAALVTVVGARVVLDWMIRRSRQRP